MKKFVLTTLFTMTSVIAFADITVSDVKVFSGHPWEEVIVGYTITGTKTKDDIIRVTATDKSANKTYVVESGSKALTGAELTEGRHVLRWNTSVDGAKFSSANVVFDVSVVDVIGGVQLWEYGPYWAECNVGAMEPEESGYYFWWGDTVGYKRNAANDGWVSVKSGESFSFTMEECPTYRKTNSTLQSLGYIDSSGNLVAEYDAAKAHLGALWRTPTVADWESLIRNCTMTLTNRKGVSGYLLTGKGAYASKSIFLPAVGRGWESSLMDTVMGYYWASSPIEDADDSIFSLSSALIFRTDSSSTRNPQLLRNTRYFGCPVRPLRGSSR